MSADLPDRLLTGEEIAAYLGLHPGTIRNKVYRREIPFEKVGGSVRFRRATIDEWIKSVPALTDDPTDEESKAASA